MQRAIRDGLIATALAIPLLLLLEAGARWLGYAESFPAPEIRPRAPGVARIVALGGSTVLGVPDGRVGFVTQLTRLLQPIAGRPVELLNFAASGAASDSVLRTFEQLEAADPDVVVLLTGHNEFLVRHPRLRPRGLLQRLRDRSALISMLDVAGGSVGLLTTEAEPLPEALDPLDRDGALFRDGIEIFRENLAAVVALAQTREVPLVLCTAPANRADWPPVHQRIAASHPDPDYDAHVSEVAGLLAAETFEPALTLARELQDRFGEDAMWRFQEAVALRGLGRSVEARPFFDRALELDPYPWRAVEAINATIRAQAGEPGVHVVDVVEIFARHAADGLVGLALVGDNVHPTPLGNAILAREIAAALAEEGWVLEPGASVASAEAVLATSEAALGQAAGRVRVAWLLSNALYVMKTPFFHFDLARRYLEQARRLAPRDWQVLANLGALSLLEGNVERGRRQLQRATAIKGSLLDPQDRRHVPYLQEALLRAGLQPPAADGS